MIRFRTRTDRNGNYLCLMIYIDNKAYIRDFNNIKCVDAPKLTKSDYRLLIKELEEHNFINKSTF